MSRQEFKYLVPVELMNKLREDVLPYLRHDYYSEIRPNKEYTVRSIYFDTSTLRSYHEKLSGLMIRKKVRIRSYNLRSDESVVFLEIKRKNMDYVSKDRVPLYLSELHEFLNTKNFDKILKKGNSDTAFVASAENFLYYLHSEGLLPIVNVVYEREAFECNIGSTLRLTFDKNLRSAVAASINDLFDDSLLKFSMPKHFVLEIKYHHLLPYWVPRIINRYNLQREAISKYTISVDRHKIHDKFFQSFSLA